MSVAEWQEAADWADFLLCVESARMYGLIADGPKVDMDRCEWILAEAKRRGITPSPHTEETWQKLTGLL